MIRKLVGSKNPILRKRARKVLSVDKKVKTLISDMKDTLLAQTDPEGIGLAAPQIGKSLRIFLMKPKSTISVVINPEIIKVAKVTKNKSDEKIMEGCLSIPHHYGPLTRAKNVTIKYLSENGEKTTKEFNGFPAQIILHEIDHLNGVLFVDRIIEQKKPLFEIKNGEWSKVDLI